MATILPPVPSESKSLTTFTRSRASTGVKRTKAKPRPSAGKLAGIDRAEVGAYRNSYKHNLCLEILQEGNVSSFIELFQLFEHQKKDREAPDNESAIKNEPLLIHQPEKLDKLKSKLVEVEDSRRNGKHNKAYDAYLDLAQYFEQFPSDEWLTDHFHKQCMKESLRVKSDEGKKQAESNYSIGIALEKRGDLTKSIEYLETFYELTQGQDWQNEDGVFLHDTACIQLYQTYTAVAEELYEQDPSECIEYLKKAYRMASEGGHKSETGMASHRLGNIYEAIGDPEVALMYHKGYLDRAKRDKNPVWTGKAYEAMARCEQSQGNLETATEYYQEFVNITKDLDDKAVYSEACSSLAYLYNILGSYDKAVENYEIAARHFANMDQERVDLLNINTAIASSHDKLASYSQAIQSGDPKVTATLMEWKDYRDRSFIDAFASGTLPIDSEQESLGTESEEKVAAIGAAAVSAPSVVPAFQRQQSPDNPADGSQYTLGESNVDVGDEASQS